VSLQPRSCAGESFADRTDLYETVKKVEDTSCAIRDVFDSLATCIGISSGPRLLSRKGFEGVGGG